MLDVDQARLAIFDGRTADAKKFAADADSAFDRAKGDRSVYMKAEADLKAPQRQDERRERYGLEGHGLRRNRRPES